MRWKSATTPNPLDLLKKPNFHYTEEEMEIGYNAQYLIEILRKMDTNEIRFELENHVTAALLRPTEQKEGEDYFCLLMPLRPTG